MRRRLLSPLLILAVLAAGCAEDDELSAGALLTEPAAAEVESADEVESAAEVESADDPAGDDVDLEAAITQVAEAWMGEGEVAVPGLTLTVLLPDGEEVGLGLGSADLAAGTPVTTDDYFRIGSISKTITSVAVLQMVDEGLLDLDATVASYLGDDWLPPYTLNGVDYGDSLTIRQILNHTDGFAEFAWDPIFYLLSSERLDVVSDPDEILAWAADRGPQHVPGEDYSYNTVGHVTAGLVIEAVTGNPAHEEIRSRVFEPLGLDTGIYLPPGESPPTAVVHGYAVGELKDQLDLLPAIEEYKEAASAAGEDYYDVLVVPQDFLESVGWTGGGIEARSAAVAAVFRAMFDGTLLSPAMVEEFTTTTPFNDYGLGLDVGEELGYTRYSHDGGVPGFESHAAYYPGLDVAIAMSANAVPTDPDVGSLARRILEIVAAE